MSRREIRRMLTRSPRHKGRWPWLIPVVLGGALVCAGIAVGIGIGLGLNSKSTDAESSEAWEQAEMAVDRPASDRIVLPSVDDDIPDAESGNPSQHSLAASTPTPAPVGGLTAEEAAPPPRTAAAQIVPSATPVAPVPPGFKGGTPPWIRYAVPAPATGGKPRVAVVIDDLGVDRRRSEKVIPLRAPLTLSWMTYAEDLPRLTAESRRHGHELMLHVPMQPLGKNWDPGPDVLEVGLPDQENRRRLLWGLQRFDGFVGINNHMGSRYTADAAGMKVVMEELRRRGLMFLDSLTTGKSVGAEMARSYGVPFAERQVFIDNEQTVAAVMAQLSKAEAYARKHGAAIVIGHPHDATIEALRQWLPELDAKGIVLVPVTALVSPPTGAITQVKGGG